MTQTRRNHYLAPATGDDAEGALAEALGGLATRRGLWLDDPGVWLHLLKSLQAQVEHRIPQAVADARDQDYSWAEIADLLGVTRASAWQRFAGGAPASASADHQSEQEPP